MTVFCIAWQNIINKLKTQANSLKEDVYTIYTMDKEDFFNMYREFLQSKNKKTNNLSFKKIIKGHDHRFTKKKKMNMDCTHVKWCLT